MSVCVCVCVCLTMHTITQKNNGSINLKLEDVVVCGNCLEYSDTGHLKIMFESYVVLMAKVLAKKL